MMCSMIYISVLSDLQTLFIISVCNNQLLHWIENELIWVLSFIPGFDSILPNLIAKLHSMKDKYLATKPPVTSNIKVRDEYVSLYNIQSHYIYIYIHCYPLFIHSSISGEQVGLFICFNLEHSGLVHVDELFRQDCELHCSEISQERARKVHICTQEQVIRANELRWVNYMNILNQLLHYSLFAGMRVRDLGGYI